MSVGTAFHPATAPLNRKQQWREWSGYYASSAYADAHDIEYNAIREAAALIDVSPLYKYVVGGPDAQRLVDRVITRDATKLQPGQVYYTPWCDEHGKVIDDGTVHRLDDDTYRWTAADPQLRWLRMNSAGLDVEIADVSECDRRARPPGPAVARRPRGGDRRVVRGSPLLPAARRDGQGRPEEARGRRLANRLHRRPRLRAVGRRRPGRRAVAGAGRCAGGLRDPAGRHARARRRPARGRADPARGRLHLGPPRDEPGAELQPGRDRPGPARQPRQGRLRRVGWRSSARRRRAARVAGSSACSSTGTTSRGCSAPRACRRRSRPSSTGRHRPVYVGGRQVGRATSVGWSPILKQAIALASVPPSHEAPGAAVDVEWTVEGRRGRVEGTVVELPFLDLERKRL